MSYSIELFVLSRSVDVAYHDVVCRLDSRVGITIRHSSGHDLFVFDHPNRIGEIAFCSKHRMFGFGVQFIGVNVRVSFESICLHSTF